MQTPLFLRAAFAWISVLSIVACMPGESNVERGNRESVLHFGNYSEPAGLDPHIAIGIPERRITGALFEGLVSKDPATLELVPAVAESWSLSKDRKTYTFKIRSEARWSNGDVLTAHDFVWSWWRVLQPALGSQYVFMYFPIKNAERYYKGELTDFSEVGIRARDGVTLEVELANPTPHFLQLLDQGSMFPVHRPTIEKFGLPDESYTSWARPGNIVSNGPFTLKTWRIFHILTVVRNEKYWNAKNVSLNGINFYPVENQTIEEHMFRAGQLHRTEEVPLGKISWYRRQYPEALRIQPFISTYFYRINGNLPELSDVNVRRALALSIDRKSLVNGVLDGLYEPAYALTPPGLIGYQPPKVFEYNPEEARRLLAQAGFPDGVQFPDIELQTNRLEHHRKIAIAVQNMWKKELNINVKVKGVGWKVYLNNEKSGNFQISRGSWAGDYVDPNTFLDLWLSDGAMNQTGFASEEYDQIILERAPAAETHDERLALFYRAESILMSQAVILPIFTTSSKHLIHPSVKGLAPNYMDYVNFRYVSLGSSKSKMSSVSTYETHMYDKREIL